MSSERFLIRCAVYLILVKDDSVLLSRRFKTGWKDGNYSLVAGHIDGNETVSTAMLREAKEEIGITIRPENLRPATVIHRYYPDQEYIDFFFVSEQWEGEPQILEPDKCDDISWFKLDELPSNLLPYVKEAIEKYKKGVPFFESGWDTKK